jgi:hypothetical protein
LAVFEAHDVHHNPVRRLSDAREAAVEQHVIAVGDDEPVLVAERVGSRLDELEEAFRAQAGYARCAGCTKATSSARQRRSPAC